jgi:acyl carrier protein
MMAKLAGLRRGVGGPAMYEFLRGILIGDLHLSDVDIRPEAGLEDAGLDSLAIVELTMVLSKRFGIEISDDDIVSVATVAQIADLIGQRVAQN